jgi:Carboxypeptidase regulatory-like domain/TonB dependent receptor
LNLFEINSLWQQNYILSGHEATVSSAHAAFPTLAILAILVMFHQVIQASLSMAAGSAFYGAETGQFDLIRGSFGRLAKNISLQVFPIRRAHRLGGEIWHASRERQTDQQHVTYGSTHEALRAMFRKEKIMTLQLKRIVLMIALITGMVGHLLAQSANATLSGFIRDSEGAVIPNAKVKAEQIATHVSYSAVSSADGAYTILNLPVGDYKVTAEAPGFKIAVVPSITLQTAQAADLNVTLPVGAVTEQVVVTDTVPLINTQDTSIGQVVENRSIESLALNGRQFWQLVALVPGATYTPGGEGTRTGGSSIRSSAVNVQINGTGFIYNGWMLDGVDVTEYEQGGTNVQPNVDALAEFKVLGANMPAIYGHTPNMVTATVKSGTNQFHGEVFEFIRNDIADAHNYFARTSKNILKRNQFGGTLGGPIVKDKLFFFSDFEETRQSQGIVFNNIVPTDAQRRGDYSTSAVKPINPYTGTRFPGDQVPISAQAAFFLPFMPTQAEANFTAPQSLIIKKGDGKVDATLGPNDHLMGRYSITDNQENDPNQFQALGTQALSSRAQNIALTEAHTFGPRWLNQASFGLYKDIFLFGAILPGTNFLAEAGITGYEQTQISPSFPYITLSGYSSFNGSGSGSFPKSNRIRTWQYGDNMSYTAGKHEIQFGGQLYYQRHAFFNGQEQEGQFNFTTKYSGDAFSDFLLGYPASVFRAYPLSLYGNTAYQWVGFVQDTWRASDRLTLNIGLRYEHNPFFNGINGQTSAFDYSNGKIVVPMNGGKLLDPNAQPEIPLLLPLFSDRIEGTDSLGLPQSIRKTGLGQLAPRFGLAYKVGGSDKYVVRAAYGLFPVYFDTNLALQWVKVPPFEITQTINNSTGTPGFTFANPFNGQSLLAANTSGQPCPGTAVVYATCTAPNVFSSPTQLQHTYMHQYNVAVQGEVAKNLSVEVAYVGNNTIHGQLIAVPDNVPVPAAGTIQTRRAYPQWGQFSLGLTNGTASYNALQVKVEKRYSNGLQILASYAYSKCLDNGSNQGAPIALSLLPRAYAECDYNLKHVVTISSVYTLPFGHGHAMLGNSNFLVNGFLGGWEIAGIYTGRSGPPYTPVLSSDVANNGTSGQWPNRISKGTISNPTPAHWFDTSAFTQPAAFSYGNSGRNILHADGLVNLDATLKKTFPFGETRGVETRLESFNVANHANFAAPNATIGSSSAGTVTSTLTANRIMQAAVKIFF